MPRPSLLPLLLLACSCWGATPAEPAPRSTGSPAALLEAAPGSAWIDLDPGDLMLVTLADGRTITVALTGMFAPVHVANIRRLVRSGWFDGTSVNRVQDGYVAQWGDGTGKKPLPAGLVAPPAEYDRPLAGLALDPLAARDAYAPRVGHVAGWAVGYDPARRRVWPVHCYGSVGVGRDLPPDVGNGAELYAVIGQAPRPLDRNIAVVGRVIDGMAVLAALPRGSGEMGFYAAKAADDRPVPITRVRLAADLPPADQPHWQMMDSRSPAYRAWAHAKADYRGDFLLQAPHALDICNLPTPVRRRPG